MELDWSIGEILNTLADLGMAENTLVYFTSDHGPHVELVGSNGKKNGGYAGPFNGIYYVLYHSLMKLAIKLI